MEELMALCAMNLAVLFIFAYSASASKFWPQTFAYRIEATAFLSLVCVRHLCNRCLKKNRARLFWDNALVILLDNYYDIVNSYVELITISNFH